MINPHARMWGSFLLGICIGGLAIVSISIPNKTPVNTDFCFLARNPDLFESRRFITYADIYSVQPHGYGLVNPSCPDEFMVFRQELYSQDHVEEIDRMHRNEPNTSIPVVFEGTLYRPEHLRNLFFAVRVRLGLSGVKDARITIRAFKAVGEQRWDSTEGGWRPVAK